MLVLVPVEKMLEARDLLLAAEAASGPLGEDEDDSGAVSRTTTGALVEAVGVVASGSGGDRIVLLPCRSPLLYTRR